jgi:hypothetical protein
VDVLSRPALSLLLVLWNQMCNCIRVANAVVVLYGLVEEMVRRGYSPRLQGTAREGLLLKGRLNEIFDLA